jgi:hypothetical protein
VPTSAQEVAALVAYVLPGFVFLKGAELFLPPRVSRGSDIAILSVLWSFPLAFAAALGLDRFAVVPSPEIVALTACSLGLLAAVAVGWLYTRRTFRLAIARFTNMSQPRIWIGLLDRQMYVQVQIDTNDVFYGYPAVISNDPAASWPDLYLRGAAAGRRRWDSRSATQYGGHLHSGRTRSDDSVPAAWTGHPDRSGVGTEIYSARGVDFIGAVRSGATAWSPET